MVKFLVGRKIRHLSRVLKKAADQECENHINVGLTAMEGMMLFRIGNQGVKVETKDLLAQFRLSKSTLSELLSSLEKKGYLVYVQSAADKRKKCVVLTEKGQQHVQNAHKVFADFEKRLLQDVEEKDLEAFERIYQKILANLGEESL